MDTCAAPLDASAEPRFLEAVDACAEPRFLPPPPAERGEGQGGGLAGTHQASEHAAALFAAFAGAGVTDVVVSPGSRSTPLVLGAAAVPALRLHDVIDERAAAFFALGQARATGRPSVLVCTSGTAPAHYFPAIIEASLAGVPLIAVTADRPPELHGCGASQTVDQLHLFGRHVRLFLDLGVGEPASAPRAAAQAVAAALEGGAVHLNVRARKPLEPEAPLAPRPPTGAVFHRAVRAPAPGAIDALAERCRRARRPLLVAGPAGAAQKLARPAVRALAAAVGAPVFADVSSNLRGPGTLSPELFLGAADPDLVIQLGGVPVSSTFERLAAPRVVIAGAGWPDPRGDAELVVHGDVGDVAQAVARALGPAEPSAWLAGWEAAGERARRAVAAISELSELGATHDVVHGPGLLVLGNSLPIRLADAVAGEVDAAVLSQRGAAGIDGLVAGAAGAAMATGLPTRLLLGDVSLLHDLGGLMLAARVATPFSIVVLNNDGGRIFEQLPVARLGDLRHFTTPHGLGFRAAAEMFGIAYARPESRAALRDALARPGVTLVEVVVPPHDAAADLARLRAEVAR